MTVSGQRRAAEGDRRRRLEREVDKSGRRRLRWQSRTKENGYAADKVLGVGAAQHSIFDLTYNFYARRTWDGKWKISRRRKCSDYFRQVQYSIFDFYLFPSEHLDRAISFDASCLLVELVFDISLLLFLQVSAKRVL
jgi:hypothetical protein